MLPRNVITASYIHDDRYIWYAMETNDSPYVHVVSNTMCTRIDTYLSIFAGQSSCFINTTTCSRWHWLFAAWLSLSAADATLTTDALASDAVITETDGAPTGNDVKVGGDVAAVVDVSIAAVDVIRVVT